MIVVPDASVIPKRVLEREDDPGHAQASKLQGQENGVRNSFLKSHTPRHLLVRTASDRQVR